MEFQQWVAENPLPWPKPAIDHRLCISTVPYESSWGKAVTTDETTYSTHVAWMDD
jgi:hypothetical protein